MALARHRSPEREGVSVCVRAAEGRRLPEAAKAARALWHHQVLHRRLGGLRAASRCRDASRRQGEHTENREQAHQSPDPDQAVAASHAVLFQDGTHARSRDWAVHQSVCIWTSHLRGANTCETPSNRSLMPLAAVPTRCSSFRLLALACQCWIPVGGDCKNKKLCEATGIKKGRDSRCIGEVP